MTHPLELSCRKTKHGPLREGKLDSDLAMASPAAHACIARVARPASSRRPARSWVLASDEGTLTCAVLVNEVDGGGQHRLVGGDVA